MKFIALSLFLCSQLADKGRVHSQNITDAIFEGDIIADYDTISSVYDNNTVSKLLEEGVIKEEPSLLRGAAPRFNLWNMNMNTADLFVINVYIDVNYSAEDYAVVKKALKKLQRKTGVLKFRFLKVKPTDGRPFLNYGKHSKEMCASYVGRVGSATSAEGQPIYLDYNCLRTGTIQHETMHALGT